jgi:competence protein ComEA
MLLPVPAASRALLVTLLLALGFAFSAPPSPAQGVDLNTADVATLSRELSGIGEARARAIIEHRQRHGPFRSVDELALIRGIGPKTIERNRARMRVVVPPGVTERSAGGVHSGKAPPAGRAVTRAGPVARPLPRPGSAPDDLPPEILIGP